MNESTKDDDINEEKKNQHEKQTLNEQITRCVLLIPYRFIELKMRLFICVFASAELAEVDFTKQMESKEQNTHKLQTNISN